MFPIKNCRDFRKKQESRLMICNIKQSHVAAFLLPALTSRAKILVHSLLTKHPIVKLVTAFLTISLFREALFLSRTWSSIPILTLYRYWALWMLCFRRIVWGIPALMSITLNIRVSITSIHWRIFSFRLYSYLWVRWGAYSDPPSTIISFIYYLSFIHVNMENKECISYDLEQRTDIDVLVFKD